MSPDAQQGKPKLSTWNSWKHKKVVLALSDLTAVYFLVHRAKFKFLLLYDYNFWKTTWDRDRFYPAQSKKKKRCPSQLMMGSNTNLLLKRVEVSFSFNFTYYFILSRKKTEKILTTLKLTKAFAFGTGWLYNDFNKSFESFSYKECILKVINYHTKTNYNLQYI